MHQRFFKIDKYDGIQFACILFCAVLAVVLWFNFWKIDVWRHDYLGYLHTYNRKLALEGRWINYFLFDFLRTAPPQLLVFSKYISIALFVFITTKNYTRSWQIGLLCAFALLQSPSIIPESLWPGVSTLPYVFLAILAIVYDEKYFLFWLILSSILFFGTFSYCYFCMPLVFLKSDDGDSLGWKNVLRKILLWILCYLVGYCVAQLITFSISDNFFSLAAWRNPNYIESLSDLADNVQRVFNIFNAFFYLAIENSYLYLFFTIPFFAYKTYKKKFPSTHVFFLLVSLSIFSNTLVAGIHLQNRSSLPLWLGFFFLASLISNATKKEAVCMSLLCTLFACSFFTVNYNNIKYYRTLTNAFKQKIASQLTVPPVEIRKIFVVSNATTRLRHREVIEQSLGIQSQGIETLLSAGRLIPSFRALGYRAPIVYAPNRPINKQSKNKQSGLLFDIHIEDGRLVIVNVY